MLKNMSYKEKFVLLKDFLPSVLETVKKDLKNDHLNKDPLFAKKYFSGKYTAKLTTEDLVQGYSEALAHEDNSEVLVEFISNRWLLKNSEVYDFFEGYLRKVSQNFSELEELEYEPSLKLMEASIEQFGAEKTYLFSVLNSVVFPKAVYDQLQTRATSQNEQQASSRNTTAGNSQSEIDRLTEWYEKKLQSLEKKYIRDTDALKKQIASLQRRLNG